jgi:hydrogenase maturation factor
MGKLTDKKLKALLECIRKNPNVIIPPMPGYDSGVHEIGDKYVVVSTDPCIGVPEKWFGWLLIHYAASDVALFGARPQFCTITLLGPPKTRSQVFLEIMKQTCHAADDLEMSIVTGHTGTYEKLSTLLGVCTAYGTVDKEKLLTPGGARAGDAIFCVKPVGLETVVNFALTRESLSRRLLGVQQTRKLSRLVSMQSCVNEALLLAKMRGVNALHDATEGGLTTALNEMAEASKVGFQIRFDMIPLARELIFLKDYFRLSNRQVISASSTGTILAAVSSEAKREVERALRRNNLEASVLGHFTKNVGRFLLEGSRKKPFPAEAEDPYERILSGKA